MLGIPRLSIKEANADGGYMPLTQPYKEGEMKMLEKEVAFQLGLGIEIIIVEELRRADHGRIKVEPAIWKRAAR